MPTEAICDRFDPRRAGDVGATLTAWPLGYPQTDARRILLKADEGLTDAEIAAALEVGSATVGRTRQCFVEANLAALEERPRPGGERKLTGKQEAHLIAVACTPAPAGQRHWTLRLLADKVVE